MKGLYDGKLTAAQASEQVLLDGTVRTGLFLAGGVVGSSTGFLLFGPAGAWVLGAGAPIRAQAATGITVAAVHRWAELPKYELWAADQHTAIDLLQNAIKAAIDIKIIQLNRKLAQYQPSSLSGYFR